MAGHSQSGKQFQGYVGKARVQRGVNNGAINQPLEILLYTSKGALEGNLCFTPFITSAPVMQAQ